MSYVKFQLPERVYKNFEDEIYLRGGECNIPKNSKGLKGNYLGAKREFKDI